MFVLHGFGREKRNCLSSVVSGSHQESKNDELGKKHWPHVSVGPMNNNAQALLLYSLTLRHTRTVSLNSPFFIFVSLAGSKTIALAAGEKAHNRRAQLQQLLGWFCVCRRMCAYVLGSTRTPPHLSLSLSLSQPDNIVDAESILPSSPDAARSLAPLLHRGGDDG